MSCGAYYRVSSRGPSRNSLEGACGASRDTSEGTYANLTLISRKYTTRSW